jgi:molybdenum cofactor cytidylyltransferase
MVNPTSVILSAGASSRMGTPKALLRLPKGCFLENIISAHREARLQVCVVLGYHAGQIESLVDLSDVQVVRNPDPSRGQLSSLHTAMEFLGAPTALLVHPVDHPLVRSSTLTLLLRSFRENPERILIPACSGRKGHPVLFGRKFWQDLLAAPLNEGARWAVKKNQPDILTVPVEDDGILFNVDTLEQYRALL